MDHGKADPFVIDENGCWVWTGRKTGRGYGAIRIGVCNCAAHRVFFERHKGKIVDGLVVDHLCRNRLCVNPAHLEQVTMKENTLRGIGPTAVNSVKTHCPKGHPYDEENVRMRRNRRYCASCDAEHKRAYKARKRLAALPKDPSTGSGS